MGCMGGGGEPGETPEEIYLADIARDKFLDYKSMYPDVENEFFKNVEKMNSDNTMRRGSESASTSVNSAYSDAKGRAVGDMTQSGVDPSEGKFSGKLSELETKQSAAGVDTTSRTQQSLQDGYLTGKSNIVRMGHGLETEAMNGFGDTASAANRSAIDSATRDYQKRQNNISAASTAVGYGLSHTNNGGDQYGNNKSGYSFSGDPFKSSSGD